MALRWKPRAGRPDVFRNLRCSQSRGGWRASLPGYGCSYSPADSRVHHYLAEVTSALDVSASLADDTIVHPFGASPDHVRPRCRPRSAQRSLSVLTEHCDVRFQHVRRDWIALTLCVHMLGVVALSKKTESGGAVQSSSSEALKSGGGRVKTTHEGQR